MLVLSRKQNEKIIIPLGELGVIEMVVIAVQKDKVRLGWTAPKEIPVHREEVFLSMLEERNAQDRST